MKELEDNFLSIDCEDSSCGLWVRDIFGKEYEGDIVSADFAKKLIEERNEAIYQSERAWKSVQRVQDERAASFAMLSKTVGKVGMTEYQPEVDLEIDARIQQIKFEKEELRECLVRLKGVYCDFYASKSNLWKKVEEVLEKTK